jgi:hypothetical protein
MHRTSRRLGGLCDRARRKSADITKHARCCFGERYFDEPLDVCAIETILIDRLRCSYVAKLRRPVCCENEQGNTRTSRFDYSRIKIRRRGARRAEKRYGLIERASESERKESCASLVDMHPGLETRLICYRKRKRRRTRARGNTNVPDSCSRHFFDKGCCKYIRIEARVTAQASGSDTVVI